MDMKLTIEFFTLGVLIAALSWPLSFASGAMAQRFSITSSIAMTEQKRSLPSSRSKRIPSKITARIAVSLLFAMLSAITALPYFASAMYLYRNEIEPIPWILAVLLALMLIGVHAYSVSPFAEDFKIQGVVPPLYGFNVSRNVRRAISSSGAQKFAIRMSWRIAADKTTTLLAALVMASILPILFYNFPDLEYHQQAYITGTTLSLIAVGVLGFVFKRRTALAGCVQQCVPILTPAAGRNAFTEFAPDQTLTWIRKSAAEIERTAWRIDKADRVTNSADRRSDASALRNIAAQLNAMVGDPGGTSEAARRRARLLISDAVTLIIGAENGAKHEEITRRYPGSGTPSRRRPPTGLARFWRSLNETNPEVITTGRWVLLVIAVVILMAIGRLSVEGLASVFN
ncbi:hypothetical protein ACFQS3_03670 [Glycomyces mayteni]|uniref:Uncharacterized protein n=1 Tax=Glycomyces mayteni TaxID=543887 RepID=A0ABW2D1W5_9ACTN|nr:hypothetical protein GCM10025732_50730 [Glycomyces mayteni]